MKIRNLGILGLFTGMLTLLVSCEKQFNDLNLDPNRPKEATPGVLLGQLQYRIVNAKMSDAKNFTHEIMQVHAPRASTSLNSVMRWFIAPRDGIWTNYYQCLLDVDDLYTIADQLGEDNYKAIALILKAYMFTILTDLYGDIPCSEATKGEDGNFLPAFDTQKAVYERVLAWFDEANALIHTDEALLYGGDMIYYGHNSAANMVKWKKLCNALKLRSLLRIRERDGEIDVTGQINEMLANPAQYPLFESNEDEAIFRYTGVFPYYNPFYNARTLDWRDGSYFTTFFLAKLNETSDPRRTIWARTVTDNGQQVYRGIESGYPVGVEYDVDANSNYTDILKTLPQLGIIMSYAEVEFIKAELALREFSSGGTPKEHYDKAISASMEQWDVAMPADFLGRPGIVYDSDQSFERQLEQIMLQKYYASFFVDYQSWFEKRRTGYPVLQKGSGIPADRVFPRRTPYPLYLQSLNAENLARAVEQMGGDDCYIRVWWDTE
ncbi:Starch-binding associating with outer membrane [Parapedobacter luteus]|uniref:Starch-binding associating with outer membrane n=1 Tax=Parapedobacter luteus TaxID=623280 RepID=A0A1T5A0Y2_9SPHI|nr:MULTISPECIES: SusD/RagB family nutrient-binding outer membrane lipoprotein [Parapedobacter]SKB28429.1 Starch-binding associating with outer membrane [Parapedobacter luteus]